ncbi:MAG TPA: hypothetical protein VNO35_35605 [Steroidobacteraceae bacterium]|nr:hypothetical protein [Steroidobacteraceae bacterium]
MRALAIDFRGHGDSSWDPLARYDVERHVSDVLQVIDTVTVTNAGHAVMSDNPEEFAKVFHSFLSDTTEVSRE